eukprot:4614363-Pyramimonas_sp.AAC.1
MVGQEALNVQGFPIKFIERHLDGDSFELSDAQCSGLAGNAFSSTPCAAMILAAYANVPTMPTPPASGSTITTMKDIRSMVDVL